MSLMVLLRESDLFCVGYMIWVDLIFRLSTEEKILL